jgi:glycosyltransferase involved in cell wall biosynthesis
MTTLHILSSPYSPVHNDNRVDPFSIAVIKFINYMHVYGWNCIHYSTAGTVVQCETVPCLTEITSDKDRDINEYNRVAGIEIGLRKQPGDMIVCFYGVENKGAADQHPDLKVVEPSIGYTTDAVFAPYRAFTSYAHMHMFYGARNMLMSPSWYDAVIPNPITPGEFTFSDTKDDYFLYFGRITEMKGINVAIQATKAAGKRLLLAGPGSLKDMGYDSTPSHVEVLGICNVEQRRKYMSQARAILGPTYYVEPFGNMVAEGYMSGTPAITTDWGGFTETVVQGVTGFRCREFREFVQAIERIDEIKPADCREYAMTNYEDSVVHEQFNTYFDKIRTNDFYRP